MTFDHPRKPLRFLRLDEGLCRWAVDVSRTTGDALFCAAVAPRGDAYCWHHRSLARRADARKPGGVPAPGRGYRPTRTGEIRGY